MLVMYDSALGYCPCRLKSFKTVRSPRFLYEIPPNYHEQAI